MTLKQTVICHGRCEASGICKLMISEGRRQRTEDRRQKTEDRRQKTENRGQKAENRRISNPQDRYRM